MKNTRKNVIALLALMIKHYREWASEEYDKNGISYLYNHWDGRAGALVTAYNLLVDVTDFEEWAKIHNFEEWAKINDFNLDK